MVYNLRLDRASMLLLQRCRPSCANSCLSKVSLLNQHYLRQFSVRTAYLRSPSWRNKCFVDRDTCMYRNKLQQSVAYGNKVRTCGLHTGTILNQTVEAVQSLEYLPNESGTITLTDNTQSSAGGDITTKSVTDHSSSADISVSSSETTVNNNDIGSESVTVPQCNEITNEGVQVAPVATDNAVREFASFPDTTAQFRSNASENVFANTESIGLTNVYDGTLASLGLGSWSTPVGWVQNVLETIHVGTGLPWWGSIVCCTVLFRVLVFPLAVKGIINNLKMQAIKPEMERLQAIMKSRKALHEPRVMGKARHDMQVLFRKHDTNPLKGLITPLVQGPLFVSFFLAIRRMTEAPVPSFLDGGTLWFSNLTVADPYYVLPCISASIMLLTIEMGHSEMGPLGDNMKWFGRIMAAIIVPITWKFPAATLMYWVTTNSFTCVQSYALRQPATKKILGIPAPLEPASGGASSAKETSAPKKSFKESLMALYEPIYKQAEVKYEAKRQEEERINKLLNPPSAKDLYLYNPTLKEQPNKGKKVNKRKHR